MYIGGIVECRTVLYKVPLFPQINDYYAGEGQLHGYIHIIHIS